MTKPNIIALVGAGGKTSLIRHLAGEAISGGQKVLVVTTTHMLKPTACGVLNNNPGAVKAMLDKEMLAVVGLPSGEDKITFCGMPLYNRICSIADLVLVEADGAKRLLVKVPLATEPVIPDNADAILCLASLSVLGAPLGEACFRLERATEILTTGFGQKAWAQEPITEAMFVYLLQKGYLEPLRKKYPDKMVRPVLTHADEEAAQQLGQHLLQVLNEPDGWILGNLPYSSYAALF